MGAEARRAVATDVRGDATGGTSRALAPGLASFVTSIRYAESTDIGGVDRCLGTGELVDLEDLWGRSGSTLRERQLEQPTPAHKLSALHDVLARRADRSGAPDSAVRHAAALLRTGQPVHATADAVGLSHRTLTRRFKDETGLTPKQYARGARLNRLVDYVNGRANLDWAEAASAAGFYDQSHLIHDFRDLTGITPGEYQPRHTTAPRHVAMPACSVPSTVRVR